MEGRSYIPHQPFTAIIVRFFFFFFEFSTPLSFDSLPSGLGVFVNLILSNNCITLNPVHLLDGALNSPSTIHTSPTAPGSGTLLHSSFGT